jgi:hypothetical protein
MKFLAPLLALIVVWLSAGPPGKLNCSKTSAYENTSCHKAGKCSKKKTPRLYQAAHSPKGMNDCCTGGVCNPFQVCVYCCFLPVDKIRLPEPLISVTQKEKTRLGSIDCISHFSGDFFQPPERPV